MATYGDQIAGMADGAGVPSGWTARWVTSGVTYTVSADAAAPGGKKLNITTSASSRRVLTLNAADADADRATTQIIALVRFNTATSGTSASISGPAARVTGGSGGETGIASIAGKNSGNGELRLLSYASGTLSVLHTSTGNAFASGDIFWLTLDVSGTSATVSIYPENDLFGTAIRTATETVPAANSTDRIGIFNFVSVTDIDFLWWSAGTGADDAPTPAPATTPVAFTGTVPTLNGTEDSAFSESVASYFSGTETPFTYSLQAGTLPAGVTLNTSTGLLSGTPTTAGTSAGIVIRATDSAADTADTNTFDIVIAVAASVRLEIDELIYVDKAKSALMTDTGFAAYVLNPTTNTLSKYFASVGVTSGVVQIVDALYETPADTFEVVLIKGNVRGVFPATVLNS